MKYLSERYVKVFSYKGYDICILKIACPEEGDEMGYRIDSEMFDNEVFEHPEDAMKKIDESLNNKKLRRS